MKVIFTPISIMVLAISIFISALIISNSIKSSESSVVESVKETEKLVYEKQLLTKEEISAYLGITTEQLDNLDMIQISRTGDGIPFLESEHTRYYTIHSIQQWLSNINHYTSNDLTEYLPSN